jgi:hypothetical protein
MHQLCGEASKSRDKPSTRLDNAPQGVGKAPPANEIHMPSRGSQVALSSGLLTPNDERHHDDNTEEPLDA